MSEFPEAAAPTAPFHPVPAAPLQGACPARSAGETPLAPPAGARRVARLERFKREQLIVDYLNRGVSVAEIAARTGVGEKRMRAIIREILARRMPQAPEEFAAIQVSRLNEALLVAFSAMSGMNLKAVDRVVRIVRELDRYHGFVAAERRRPEPSRVGAPAAGTAAFGAALICRAEPAPPAPDELEFAPAMECSLMSGDSLKAESAAADLVPVSRGAPAGPSVSASSGVLRGAQDEVRQAQDEDAGFAAPRPAGAARPEDPPQALDTMDFTPGFDASRSNGPVASPGVDARASGDAPANSAVASKNAPASSAVAASPIVVRQAPDEGAGLAAPGPAGVARPEERPQSFEDVRFAPGASASAEWAAPADGAVSPATLSAAAAGFAKVRMILNGAAAC